MTTTPDQPKPGTPRPDDEPESGTVEYLEGRETKPPAELTDPQFDDDGDGEPQQS